MGDELWIRLKIALAGAVAERLEGYRKLTRAQRDCYSARNPDLVPLTAISPQPERGVVSPWVALHEAGHAVMAWRYGVEMIGASIISNGDNAGRVHMAGSHALSALGLASARDLEAARAVAGALARLVSPVPRPRLARWIIQQARIETRVELNHHRQHLHQLSAALQSRAVLFADEIAELLAGCPRGPLPAAVLEWAGLPSFSELMERAAAFNCQRSSQ